jgi:hypothetical protein
VTNTWWRAAVFDTAEIDDGDDDDGMYSNHRYSMTLFDVRIATLKRVQLWKWQRVVLLFPSSVRQL